QDPAREVAARVARLLGGRRNRVEADEREEDDRGARLDALETVRREGNVVRGFDVKRADYDDSEEKHDLHEDDQVVETRGFLDAPRAERRDDDRDDHRE